ncbi:PREDICTED: serine/arginine-rich splicing factor SC35-like isoform X1 [Populus euphratica]|uniref:Serine/arginine-rich splicing factor SC35-like isoform X1 n=1 Tax=Populus euphratica TaxID=75702 RepID=A0AAJ6X4A1_POPEU|nr:PREDICTED: serine/arginine-rich splicing factor SC35-like isoform X1 [Populus euphratica]XP_011004809.1 PREDICTED: serine/arginine-rich splicing factor SC35-like isoform X1 [Populus euphratica]XP_011004810.1 PREDICTED: serine/arginine-rich splicing factor SC35-like isoform X1 [Populus euphratica]XP_011004811.1 PREDICTED: serine/arginine-rich splicing factor SC35-like isoform X1 [Populus euphratica]XP_011004813.1 PREDICTED: serine/arginine-rich splicing factor SC35-like isoform X1 [Populus eu
MSHFGRSGPPDIRDTFSLLVLNITFRTTADDLFPLFDKYGKVVDVFIPRDRRTGESRGFAFVRYKYAEEAQKAVDKLDGRVVDGREIMVQFAKYGPNAERIQSGRIVESSSKIKGRSRSRSPRPRYRDGYRDKDRDRDYRRRSRSRSRDRYDRDGYRGRDRDYHPRSVSHSPDHRKECGRGHDEKRRRRSQSYGSPNSPRSPSPHRAHPRDRSPNGRNDNKCSPNGSPNSPRSPSPHRAHPRDGSPNGRNDNKRSPTSKGVSPCNEPVES